MKLRRRSVFAIALLVIGFAILSWFVLSYEGVSDSESVEIVQVEIAPHNQIAMLIRRRDHAALSGDTYFVFIEHHLYSVPELRKELYSLHPIFKAGRDGIALHWSQSNELTIECRNCGITKDMIETQKFSERTIIIRYVGFPNAKNVGLRDGSAVGARHAYPSA